MYVFYSYNQENKQKSARHHFCVRNCGGDAVMHSWCTSWNKNRSIWMRAVARGGRARELHISKWNVQGCVLYGWWTPGKCMRVLHNFQGTCYTTQISSGKVQVMVYPYPRYCGEGHTELTEVPGTGMNVVQISRKFQVRVWTSYRTSPKFRVRVWKYYGSQRIFGYCDTSVQNPQKFRAGIKMLYRYPGCCGHERAGLKKGSGYGYECHTEVTEVLCGVIPG